MSPHGLLAPAENAQTSSARAISRLQLGVGDPMSYDESVREFFADGSWVHLGHPTTPANQPRWRHIARSTVRLVSRARRQRDEQRRHQARDFSRRMHLMPFWWGRDASLPFRSRSFQFIFSEHFFEHIFQDEAFALFQECHRLLTPGGVMRISVPDADLRVYDDIEPVAFDARCGTTTRDPGRWNDPNTHKTRWNVYSLSLLLRLAGFEVVPNAYCDRFGEYVRRSVRHGDDRFPAGSDWGALCTTQYLRRPDSLIIDAIQTPA